MPTDLTKRMTEIAAQMSGDFGLDIHIGSIDGTSYCDVVLTDGPTDAVEFTGPPETVEEGIAAALKEMDKRRLSP